jgi:hypothetical protein
MMTRQERRNASELKEVYEIKIFLKSTNLIYRFSS